MLNDFELEGAPVPARKEQFEELGYYGADIVMRLCSWYQNKTDISYFMTITSHLMNYWSKNLGRGNNKN